MSDWSACPKVTKDVCVSALTLTVALNCLPAVASGSVSQEALAVGAVLLLVFGLLSANKGAAISTLPDSAACGPASKDVCFSAVALTIALNSIPAFFCTRDATGGTSIEPLVGSILLLGLGCMYANNKHKAPLSVSAPTTRAQMRHQSTSDWSPTSILPHFEAPPKIEKLPGAFTRRSKSPSR